MGIHHPTDIDVFDIVSATVANPGANSQFTFTVDANSRAQIIGCTFDLIIDNAGASRLVDVYGYDGTRRFQHSHAAALAPINDTTFIYFAVGIDPINHQPTRPYITGKLADELYLNPGDSFRSDIDIMDADVEIQNIEIHYKRWIME